MDRLFVYGTLQPGGPNEHVMTAIGGDWTRATVKGRLVEGGWGAELGFPGLVIDECGNDIEGYVFSSSALKLHWDYLDAFEGAAYRRVTVAVALQHGEYVDASVYVLTEAEQRLS